MKPKIYLVEYIHPTALAKLQEQAEIVDDPRLADGALNRNYRMDRAWIEACPNLKVIGVHGTGTDGVDLAAARERGIRVVYAPGENARSVSELIVAFALMLSRNLQQWDRRISSGVTCEVGGASLPGRELSGKTFGMIGCGRISMGAAKILRDGFGMELAGWSRSLTPESAAEQGIRYCRDPRGIFAVSDVVCIGTSMNAETRNLVNAQVLADAKPGCLLINTARGGIVNEQDLYDALISGRIAGAACDVFTEEPPTRKNPLVTLPNFIATPHIGGNTEEALYRVSNSTVDQMLAVLDGKTEGVHFAE